ncbi:MAG TPA: peptidoglycan editing factor PgeF [Actinomycetota bacterium]|nr:peptidoglycan editing factor PgeF [Actinomycetota bacterium]
MERRRLPGGVHVLVSETLERVGVLAAFSERGGGVSEGPFASLNVGFGVGDRPEAVRENRRRLAEGLGVGAFAVAGLVHGSRVVRVGRGRAGAGFLDPAGRIPAADGLLTSTPAVPLAVTCADCLPVALASGDGRTICVVHAGWRGLAAGILSRTLAAFPEPRTVRAAIGPAVGPCHYEVGEDVALAVAAGSGAGAVARRAGGRIRLDLAATARAVLRAAGVRRIEVADVCTACEARRFFSHRRDGRTGRQAAICMRLPG